MIGISQCLGDIQLKTVEQSTQNAGGRKRSQRRGSQPYAD